MTESSRRSPLAAWIEAMRLRTLPVSLAGVIMALGYALLYGTVKWMPWTICLAFAVLAQIASNFANEYFDYRDGLDKAGREGPRRGVTEGDITPRAMLVATLVTLALACLLGLSLLLWGPWWLIPVGVVIALGVMAYSTGPYPLSRHGLGEVAVIAFFGLIPVNFTYFLQAGAFSLDVFIGSVAIGLMGANVLLVNNYRDVDDDAAVGKTTLAVRFGRATALGLYLFNGIIAAVLLAWTQPWFTVVAAAYLLVHLLIFNFIRTHRGRALNPMLGITALAMLGVAIAFTICSL